MSIKGNELISDCSIELTIGRRYGLIGQNGCGKTNFLQALANRDVSHSCALVPACPRVPEVLEAMLDDGGRTCTGVLASRPTSR